MKRLYLALSLSLPVTLAVTGCASGTATQVHPGSADAIDSAVFDSLVTIKASLDQAKTDYAALTVDQQRAVGPIINKIGAAYDEANAARAIYHQARLAGNSPDPATLQAQVADLTKQITALAAQIGGFKK